MFDQLHSGELYYPMDDTVLHEQLQYLELLYDYNQTRPLEQERRAALLRRMFAEIGERDREFYFRDRRVDDCPLVHREAE